MMARLKQINALVAIAMVVLFVVHGVLGAFQMFGIGSPTMRILAWTLVALVIVHACIGVALTVITLHTQRAAGATYPKANKRFWISRITGLLLIILVVAHIVVFFNTAQGVVRVNYFGVAELVLQVLLVVMLAAHVLVNVKSLLISLGLQSQRPRSKDIIIGLGVILIFFLIAFAVYFTRWTS